ncbi:MAG: hypothetical protein KKH22_05190 [Proteobacteria bacterium]|nr:hypothetical protein [Pseudomonadota bacterium]
MELPDDLAQKGNCRFFVSSGTILSASTYKTTQVWSENNFVPNFGGGGVVVQNIKSQDVQHSDFWLRCANGKEQHVSLNSLEAHARDGHQVSLVGAECGDSSYWVAFVNHDSRRYTWIVYDVLLSPSIVVPVAWFLFMVFVLQVGRRPTYSLGMAIAMAAVSSFLVTWPYRAIARYFKRSAMDSHIREVAKWVSGKGIDRPEEVPRREVLADTSDPQLVLPVAQTTPVMGQVFCTECGTALVVSDIFCDACGNRMAALETMQQNM